MGLVSNFAGYGATNNKPQIETLQLGVYRVLIEKNTSSFLGTDFNALYERAISGTKIMRRLITDVVCLAPGMVFLMGLVRIWDSIENVILLSLETRILHIVRGLHTCHTGLIVFLDRLRLAFQMEK